MILVRIMRIKNRLNGHLLVGFFLSFQHNKAVYPLYYIFMIKICPKCLNNFVRKDGKEN